MGLDLGEEKSNKTIVFFKNLKNSKMFKVFLLIVLINIIFATFYGYLEDLPFHLSLYWATDTITNTGTGLVPPSQPFTWYLTTFLMWAGLGITLTFVQFVYVKILEKNRGNEKITYKKHIILIGWNAKMRYFLANIPGVLGAHHNYVLINEINSRPFDLPQVVGYIQGNPTEERILKNANIEEAEQVIITVENDATTVLIAMTIQGLNPKVKISANLDKKENVKHLLRIGIKEIICDEELTGKAMIDAFYSNQGKEEK